MSLLRPGVTKQHKTSRKGVQSLGKDCGTVQIVLCPGDAFQSIWYWCNNNFLSILTLSFGSNSAPHENVARASQSKKSPIQRMKKQSCISAMLVDMADMPEHMPAMSALGEIRHPCTLYIAAGTQVTNVP